MTTICGTPEYRYRIKASTSVSEPALIARVPRARHRSISDPATIARTAATDPGETLSSVTPRPIGNGMHAGSTLDVDVVRVGQVLSNLVGNARKYAPDGSPIVVAATVDRPWLVVTVDDEGVGVPETDRHLVTEPFHRAWNVRESRIPGTGLGLFICRRLVEAHGGLLDILDRPDGRAGTRVRFTLPLAGTAAEAVDG